MKWYKKLAIALPVLVGIAGFYSNQRYALTVRVDATDEMGLSHTRQQSLVLYVFR
ncbi:MAG: hypothetical protein HY363_02685 [Candidatus Aenigmarchaeota archaeon]|nr:hypothetical protein [Candidatus Aenigmarchaeota archaeon]